MVFDFLKLLLIYVKEFIRFSANSYVIVDHWMTVVNFKAQRKRTISKKIISGPDFYNKCD